MTNKLTRIWRAIIRLRSGLTQAIHIEADDYFRAKALIETLYGQGSIFQGPTEVKGK